MYYTYAIKSKVRNYIYVGLSGNIERRLLDHSEKRNKTTAPYAPFEVLLIEEYPTRVLAREREKYLKSGIGKEFLRKI